MSLGRIPARVLIWTMVGAAFGALMISKSSGIRPEQVISGVVIGGIVGAIGGQFLQTLVRPKTNRKRQAE